MKMCSAFGSILVVWMGCIQQASSDEFMRWQAAEFMATLRYLQNGVATPGVNDIFAREIDDFVRVEDIRIGTICPGTTGGTVDKGWPFFGARFLPLIGADKPSFYSVSYLGGAVDYHEGQSFDALVTPSDIMRALDGDLCPVTKKGISESHVVENGYAHLTREGHFAPLSWGALDIDGDSKGDFTFGGLLYLSSHNYESALGSKWIGAESVFIRTDRGVRLVRFQDRTLIVERFENGSLVAEHQEVVAESTATNSGHSLVVLPGRNKGEDSIALRMHCGFKTFRYEEGNIVPGSGCIQGLAGQWALPGGRGDFDGDGFEDFWISQTHLGEDVSLELDSAVLVSGALLAKSSPNASLSSIAIATIHGSSRFSDHDGIATTMSPFAGDIDNDGIPDLSFSGHRHMNEAGALYILYGKDIEVGMDISIEDLRIQKIAGPMMSQLAPPYHHWDATDWDGDGYDDIVITADNDLRSGYNAGAIYILSGYRLQTVQ
ncbi:FG-GAP repeat protein [Hoeflea sp.]|uniref:FG-GAP repeat protein n=1 Tax=Hoeflea sp. TaxID=1940281 RepID=UPI003BAE4DD8